MDNRLRKDLKRIVMMYWSGMPLEWALLVFFTLATAVFAGLLPIALAVWIPVMGLMAYRSMPWKRLAAFFIVFLRYNTQ